MDLVVIIMPKADGKRWSKSGREKQVTKKLVECVLVAQRQTLTNSRVNLDSISASLLLPPPPTHGRLKSSSRMKAPNHATVCCQTIEIAVTGGRLLARHSTRHPVIC